MVKSGKLNLIAITADKFDAVPTAFTNAYLQLDVNYYVGLHGVP